MFANCLQRVYDGHIKTDREVDMTIAEIEVRIGKLEAAIVNEDMSFNRFLLLAGELVGLNTALPWSGNKEPESAWHILDRLRGI